MTDRAPAQPGASPAPPTSTTSARTPARRRTGRRSPTGIPQWTRWLGVTVAPLAPAAAGQPALWVISAGAGAGHVAAVFPDGAEADTISSGRTQP